MAEKLVEPKSCLASGSSSVLYCSMHLHHLWSSNLAWTNNYLHIVHPHGRRVRFKILDYLIRLVSFEQSAVKVTTISGLAGEGECLYSHCYSCVNKFIEAGGDQDGQESNAAAGASGQEEQPAKRKQARRLTRADKGAWRDTTVLNDEVWFRPHGAFETYPFTQILSRIQKFLKAVSV